MRIETIVSNTLTKGANLHGNTMTGDVADGDHDLEAGKIRFAKGELGQLSHGRSRHPLPRG